MSDRSLEGQVAIVTGASRGIGQALAQELASRQAKVVLAARIESACRHVADAIRDEGGEATAIACDVTRYPEVEALVRGAENRYGGLDIMINNAGAIEPIGFLETCDPEVWARNVAVNLIGAFHTCRAAFGRFTQRGRGVIVNLSSGAAHRPLEGWSAYCSAKAGLAMLTEVIATEASATGVRVYGVQPGVVDTDMQQRIRESGINYVSRIPRGELLPPAEPARLIAWLCTEEAADLAGRELSVRDPDLRKRAGLA